MFRCQRQRHLGRARFRLRRVIDEHLVPIDFEIGDQPNATCARGQLARQVDDNGALKTCREARFAGDALPDPSGNCAST